MGDTLDPKALEAAHDAYILNLPEDRRPRNHRPPLLLRALGTAVTAYLAALPTEASEPVDNALLPNKVLFDNQARAQAADGASGNMVIDTSVALAMIAEIIRSRRPAPVSSAVPVAWRVASSNGYEYYTFKPEDRLFPEPLYAGSSNAE